MRTLFAVGVPLGVATTCHADDALASKFLRSQVLHKDLTPAEAAAIRKAGGAQQPAQPPVGPHRLVIRHGARQHAPAAQQPVTSGRYAKGPQACPAHATGCLESVLRCPGGRLDGGPGAVRPGCRRVVFASRNAALLSRTASRPIATGVCRSLRTRPPT